MDLLRQRGNIKVLARVVELKQSGAELMVFTKVNVCICCGARNVGLIKLKSCLHKEFLECYFKNRINFTISVICHYCHSILKKIVDFKKQVEQCLTNWQQMLSPKPKLTALPKPISIIVPSKHIKEKNTNIPETVNKKPTAMYIKPEIMCEEPEIMCKKPEMMFKQPEMMCKELDVAVKQEPLSTEEIDMDSERPKSCDTDFAEVPVLTDDTEETNFETRTYIMRGNKTQELRIENNVTPVDYYKTEDYQTTTDESLAGKVVTVVLSTEEVERERDIKRRDKRYKSMAFKCEDCVLGFHSKEGFANHMKKHDRTLGDFVCRVCKFVFATEGSLRAHEKIHWLRYQCVPCGKRFQGRVVYCISHYNKHHATKEDKIDQTLECGLMDCDFVCSDITEYKRHTRSHLSRVSCDKCTKTFATTGSLKIHVNRVHHKIRPVYECKDCGKQYKSSGGLRSHELTEHTPADKMPMYYCRICDKLYKNHMSLYAHNKRHENSDHKFICDICGAEFNYKDAIRNHMDIVHLNTEYKCKHCDKISNTLVSHKRHIKEKHTANQTPKIKILCDLCGKEFRTNATLKSHMITHTGERPYKCCFCPATFGFSSALYTHKRLVHKQQKRKK